jgi:hypothetical protein
MSQPTKRGLKASLLIPGFASLLLLYWQRSWPQPITGMYLGLAGALLVIQAIWLGFGKRWIRFPVVAIGIAYIVYVLSAGNLLSRRNDLVAIYCFSVFALVLIPSVFSRFAYKVELLPRTIQRKSNEPPRQFGVISLLGLMTGIAILIAFQQWELDHEHVHGVSPERWYIKHAIFFALATGVAVRSILGCDFIRPLIVSMGIGIIATVAAYLFGNFRYVSGVRFGSSVLFGWMLITAYCFLLRYAGLRFRSNQKEDPKLPQNNGH